MNSMETDFKAQGIATLDHGFVFRKILYQYAIEGVVIKQKRLVPNALFMTKDGIIYNKPLIGEASEVFASLQEFIKTSKENGAIRIGLVAEGLGLFRPETEWRLPSREEFLSESQHRFVIMIDATRNNQHEAILEIIEKGGRTELADRRRATAGNDLDGILDMLRGAFDDQPLGTIQ